MRFVPLQQSGSVLAGIPKRRTLYFDANGQKNQEDNGRFSPGFSRRFGHFFRKGRRSRREGEGAEPLLLKTEWQQWNGGICSKNHLIDCNMEETEKK
jgi:hypothetical protein